MVDSGLAVDRVHRRVLCQVRNRRRRVVGAGSGVVEQGGDGLGGGVGEGGPDAGLDLLGAVEDLDVQGGEEVLDQGGRGAGNGRGEVGQFVEDGGVFVGGVGGVEGVELGLGGGALVVVFAVAGADAGPVGLGGGAGVGAELFQFGEQPAWAVSVRAMSADSRACSRARAAACSAVVAGIRSASMAARS